MAIEDDADIEALFDVNEFGETVLADGVPVAVIWEDSPNEEFDDIDATSTTAIGAAHVLAAVQVGSTIVRNALSYRVHDTELDGTGKTKTLYLARI